MNKAVFVHVAVVCMSVFASHAKAELPLTVENLITKEGSLKLDLSLTYANKDREGVEAGQVVLVQTGDSSYVYIPTGYGTSQTNVDTFITTLGLRMGVTPSSEIYTRANFYYSDYRYLAADDQSASGSDNGFLDAWLGLNYRFSEDNETPALLGFIEGALREKGQQSSSSAKSWAVGFTTYRALDPVVLSMSASYRFNLDRKDGDSEYNPGNYLAINPSVSFAVNDRVTLTTGVQWINKQPDQWSDQRDGIRQTNTDLMLGLGYGVSKGSTMSFSFKTDATGRDGADLRFNWLKAF
jgi:hypothetical protein